MENINILKLLLFQSSFLFMNLEKTCLEKKDLNWFYQFYQIIFFRTCKLLNIYDKDLKFIFLNKENLTKKKEFFELYNFMYNYIENNKNDYNNLIL